MCGTIWISISLLESFLFYNTKYVCILFFFILICNFDLINAIKLFLHSLKSLDVDFCFFFLEFCFIYCIMCFIILSAVQLISIVYLFLVHNYLFKSLFAPLKVRRLKPQQSKHVLLPFSSCTFPLQ